MIGHALRLSVNVSVRCWDGRTPELEKLAREDQGQLLWSSVGHNLVGSPGRNLIRDFLDDTSPTGLTHFAIGTSNAAINDADIALDAEAHRDVITQRVLSPSAVTVKYFLGSSVLNGLTLREAGLFNASSGGTMFARWLIVPEIVKTSLLVYTFGWVIGIYAE